ncbi:MAG: PorT family protein [Paludibacteraceae bacterium]|nr:PorT family protein [Paludibacteraceae bacterium]MBO7316224.1 PorT family protein [Paludibacteraceae bacterium]
MKKRLGLLFFAATLASSLWSQSIGLLGGYALTNANPSIDSDKIHFKKTPTSGFVVGPIFSWNFHPYLGFDVSVLSTMRGGDFRISVEGNTSDIIYKRTLYYVSAPLHIYFYHQIKDVELSFFVGPSLNFGLEAKDYAYLDNEFKKPLMDTETDETVIFGKDNYLSMFEVAADFGVNVKYKNILFRTSYQYSINNLAKNKAYVYALGNLVSGSLKETYRQGVFTLSVGYVLDFKKKQRTYSK